MLVHVPVFIMPHPLLIVSIVESLRLSLATLEEEKNLLQEQMISQNEKEEIHITETEKMKKEIDRQTEKLKKKQERSSERMSCDL